MIILSYWSRISQVNVPEDINKTTMQYHNINEVSSGDNGYGALAAGTFDKIDGFHAVNKMWIPS